MTASVGTGVRLSPNGDHWNTTFNGEIDAISNLAGALLTGSTTDNPGFSQSIGTSSSLVLSPDSSRLNAWFSNSSSENLLYICLATGATNATILSTSSAVLPANPLRTRLTLSNDGIAVQWIALGPSASVGAGILLMPQGDRRIIEGYTGQVSSIHAWAGASMNLCIQEEV